MILDKNAFWEKGLEQTRKQWPWPEYKGVLPPLCDRCVDLIDAGQPAVCNCVRKNMTTESVTNGK